MKKRIGIVLFTILLMTGCRSSKETIQENIIKEEATITATPSIEPVTSDYKSPITSPTTQNEKEKKEKLETQSESSMTHSGKETVVTNNALLGSWVTTIGNQVAKFMFDEETVTLTYYYLNEKHEETADYKVVDNKLCLSVLGGELETYNIQLQETDDTLCISIEEECIVLYRETSKIGKEIMKHIEYYWIGDWMVVKEDQSPVAHWIFKSEDEIICKRLGEKEKGLHYKKQQIKEEWELSIDGESYRLQTKDFMICVKNGENEFYLIPTNSRDGKRAMDQLTILENDGSLEKRNVRVDDVSITLTAPNNIMLEDYIAIHSVEKCGLPGAYGAFYEVKIESLATKDAVMSFAYQTKDLLYDCEQDLAIGYMNTKNGKSKIIASTHDLTLHSVSIPFQGDGYYFLVDQYIYDGNKRDKETMNPYATEWAKNNNTGDICSLVDLTYIKESKGEFKVHNAKELASVVYYVNTIDDSPVISIENDIDLSSYEWAPMGWGEANEDHPFSGRIDGNSHVISGMKIEGGSDVGFLGWSTFCGVYDLTIKDAIVTGYSCVGILNGEAICGSFYNCMVTGAVTGESQIGTMFGHEANGTITECSADVTVNGKKSEFLSSNEEAKSKIVVENKVTITLGDDCTVTRPEAEGFKNLEWVVKLNGVEILNRNAEGEYSYRYKGRDPGEYEIYLNAYVEGQYVPVSNSVYYSIP